MKRIKQKPIIISVVICALILSVYFCFFNRKQKVIVLDKPISNSQNIEIVNAVKENEADQTDSQLNSDTKTAGKEPEEPANASYLIKMPFLVQAPEANWDTVHEDACEETSLIMVQTYMNKTQAITKTEGEKSILSLVDYEDKNSYGTSITLKELNQIAKDYFKMNTGRVESATIDKIKKEIASGRPVILPAAGKVLFNPNFKNGGPNYHMLVVKGYDKDGFITNDLGTRKGEGYSYPFDTIFNAIHDWNPDNILNGPKNYLVFD
jgi:uncharacterized protein YvpB